MTNDDRKETPAKDDITQRLRSMMGLPSGIPIEVSLDLGPMAPSDGPSTISFCDPRHANEFKVFVKYENEDGGLRWLIGDEEANELLKRGPLLVCAVIGFPPDVIPHQDIVKAARFAEGANPGEVRHFVPEDHQHRKLCLGGPVAFQVGRYRCPAFWERDEVVKLPLVVGVSYPIDNENGE